MFELASPWVLIGLPLPFLLWYFLPRAQLKLPAALKVPFYNAIAQVVDQNQKKIVGHSRITIPLIIWILLLLALAGPRWVGNPQPLEREGHNIMLTLDISGSMELADMTLNGRPATRLAVVKQTAMQFVRERKQDKIGLILFGTNAYLQTPLTYDRANIIMRLDDATVGLAGQTTSIGDAIGLAVKRFQNVPTKGRVIILLTDGANNSGVLSPDKAAEIAKSDHIKIYTIGLGGGEVSPNAFNGMFLNMNAADLDEDTLREVAKVTGGRYFLATDQKSLQHIYATINQLETSTQDQESVRPQHDYYPWVLGLAFMLLLIWLGMQGNWAFSPSVKQNEVFE